MQWYMKWHANGGILINKQTRFSHAGARNEVQQVGISSTYFRESHNVNRSPPPSKVPKAIKRTAQRCIDSGRQEEKNTEFKPLSIDLLKGFWPQYSCNGQNLDVFGNSNPRDRRSYNTLEGIKTGQGWSKDESSIYYNQSGTPAIKFPSRAVHETKILCKWQKFRVQS